MQDDKGREWILTVQDHFTKFLWTKAFKTKEASPIAVYLMNVFMDGVCMPERWHADNGGEFKNFHIDAVRQHLGANCQTGMLLPYSHSMPRNPQCQGLVERANGTIKKTTHKKMEADGFVIGEDTTWNWVATLKAVTRAWNRRVVKLYGFCPAFLMTGQPPEAPDHQSLNPAELLEVHEHCAYQMQRQGAKMATTVFNESFTRGEVVLVHQLKKRSHKDLRGGGGKSYTARAVIVTQSRTNATHYRLRWITDGLADKEKAGELSKRMWLAWRLKRAVKTAAVNGQQSFPDDQRIVDMVMEECSEDAYDLSASGDEDTGPALPDHEAIAREADRLLCDWLCEHHDHTPCDVMSKCHLKSI
jgi:transposase InsO family protein